MFLCYCFEPRLRGPPTVAPFNSGLRARTSNHIQLHSRTNFPTPRVSPSPPFPVFSCLLVCSILRISAMSLFGSLGSSQPQSSNSLFGGLANNNNNNNSGNSLGQSTPSNTFGGNSLFSGGQGQAASQQGQAPNQTASSLFGGSTLVGSSQTQGQPQGPSLFGQQPQTQQQTNAGTAGSLFGKTQAPQQPSTSAEQSVQPAGGSVFGGSILNNGRSQDPLKQSQRPTGLFMTLTEQAEKRRRLEGGERQGDGLPTLQLGLNDIASKIRRINGAGVAGPPSKRESARA